MRIVKYCFEEKDRIFIGFVMGLAISVFCMALAALINPNLFHLLSFAFLSVGVGGFFFITTQSNEDDKDYT